MSLLLQCGWAVAAILGHFVLWVGLVNRLHAWPLPRKWIDGTTVVMGVAILFGLPSLLVTTLPDVLLPVYHPLPVQWMPTGLAQSYTYLATTVAVASGLHTIHLWLHPERRGTLLSQRHYPVAMGGISPAELLAPGWPQRLGALPGNQVVTPVVAEKELLLPRLPAAVEGLRIAHLSDLHLSDRIQKPYFELLVEQVNALDVDLIAITGDIVDENDCLDWLDTVFAHLRCRHQKLFVLGNHDLRSDNQQTRQRLVAGGFIDMGGRCERFSLGKTASRGKTEYLVAGNEAPWFAPVPQIPPPSPTAEGEFRLAVVHTPDHFTWAQRQQFDLMLAGHNHGGQIQFPLVGAACSPSRHGTRYASGVFQAQGTVMHVSAGSASHAPVRWNCPPEIALLTLRCQAW